MSVTVHAVPHRRCRDAGDDHFLVSARARIWGVAMRWKVLLSASLGTWLMLTPSSDDSAREVHTMTSTTCNVAPGTDG